MRPAAVAPPAQRPMCLRCRRPASVCYCAAVPQLPTRTKVVILQHPRERDMPIGTARMASLCLPDARLHTGMRWDDKPAVVAALTDPAHPAILLYPGPDARDVLTDPPAGPVTLVVVDGTWSQAKTIVRDNPILRSLPRYAFAAPELSQYRIRREPKDEYCSTIEALMHVLGALEGDPAKFRAMLTPFRAMVDAQLAAQATSPGRPRVAKPIGPRGPRVPAIIAARYQDLVCVVGEANAWPYRRNEDGTIGRSEGVDELVNFVAVRPRTGETFAMIARPDGPLSPTAPFHLELTEAQITGAAAKAALVAAFAAFSRPTDILCGWGCYSMKLLRRSGGVLGEPALDLRAIVQRVRNAKLGTLDAYAMSRGFPAVPPSGPGRAGRRAALLAQVAAELHARAQP